MICMCKRGDSKLYISCTVQLMRRDVHDHLFIAAVYPISSMLKGCASRWKMLRAPFLGSYIKQKVILYKGKKVLPHSFSTLFILAFDFFHLC